MRDKESVFRQLGASNHSLGERQEEDFYATEPKATELLLENETFNSLIWECACGDGSMSKVLEEAGYKVISSDIVDRGYPNTKIIDFLSTTETNLNLDIVTNPPYKNSVDFVNHALEVVAEGCKVAMFLKLTFLEGKSRKKLFLSNPPKILYVSSSRLNCAKNGDFETYSIIRAIAYGWYVWEKGYKGQTIIKWIN